MVRKRHLYLISGYDPVGAGGHYRRFVRGLATFARTWNVTAAVSELSNPLANAARHWTVTTQAGNWRVQSTYHPMAWDDIVLADFARPIPQRLARFGLAFLEFVQTGTAFRFFRTSFKYGLFFLFPMFHLIVFSVAGIALGRVIAAHWQLEGLASFLATAAVALAGFLGLLRWPGRRWRVSQALDDWIFSSDYLHRRRPDVEARLDQFAQDLVARVRAADCDEIVVIGHSLGATLAVSVVARALMRDPALGTRGPSVCLLTVGSTIPKFTLHPDADQIRCEVALVALAPSIVWAEYHARADPISFYKFDPATGPVERDRFERKPIIRLVRLRAMLEERTYRRIQLKFMRLHHQFVMANERRTAYDYYMMGCGPVAFERTVMAMSGAVDLIAADGTLIERTTEPPARLAASA